jgi:hypothetical protein
LVLGARERVSPSSPPSPSRRSWPSLPPERLPRSGTPREGS